MTREDASEHPERPNIVLVISHDLGAHFGPYGHAVEHCPRLMGFAARSMRFDKHFVSSPGCSQSRSSLVTGRYPHANGQFGLGNWGWKMHEDEELLPAVLREAGYHTALIGIWHLHEWTLGAFDTVSDDVSTIDRSPEGYTEVAAPRASDWIKHRAPSDKPFYLHVGLWEVHRPFCGTPEERAMLSPAPEDEVPDYLPCNEPTRREFAELHRSLSVADRGLGVILDALDEAGVAENTLVIFTADHGLPFPRAKGTCYDPGVRVGLLARWPGRIRAGSVCDRLTGNVDVMPTLLEIAGAPTPGRVQGQSFAGLLFDGAPTGAPGGEPRTAVYAEKTYHEHYDPIRAVRTDRYKYIRNFAPRPNLVLPSDIYNSPTRISITDDEFVWATRPEHELYDLESDPGERENLAGDPAHAETLHA
ncbi:MAG: sulfatase family protein, partial [Planctomycetota bacterium]